MSTPQESDEVKKLQAKIQLLTTACKKISEQIKTDIVVFTEQINGKSYVPKSRIDALQMSVEKYVLATIAQLNDEPISREEYIRRKMNPRTRN